jgi:hypothetical protein
MDPILLKPPWIRPILARSRKGGALFFGLRIADLGYEMWDVRFGIWNCKLPTGKTGSTGKTGQTCKGNRVKAFEFALCSMLSSTDYLIPWFSDLPMVHWGSHSIKDLSSAEREVCRSFWMARFSICRMRSFDTPSLPPMVLRV